MNANKRVALIFSTIILIAFSAIWFSVVDPYYRTNKELSAVIVKKVHATGKLGAVVEITAKLENGEVYYFSSAKYKGNVGDKITLYLHKRKITGLSKYSHN